MKRTHPGWTCEWCSTEHHDCSQRCRICRRYRQLGEEEAARRDRQNEWKMATGVALGAGTTSSRGTRNAVGAGPRSRTHCKLVVGTTIGGEPG